MLYQRYVPGDIDAEKSAAPKDRKVWRESRTSLLSGWADGSEEKSGRRLQFGTE